MKRDAVHLKPLPPVRMRGALGKMARRLRRVRPAGWLAITAAVLAFLSFFHPAALWQMLCRAVAAQKFLVCMLAALGLLAISLIWAAGQRIDAWIFMLINKRGERPRWLDQTMLAVTQLGNGLFAYALAAVLLVLRQRMLAYELLFGNLTLWLMVELMKVFIQRQRPYSFLSGARILGHRERGHSFPSGHTSQSFFVASLLSHSVHTGIGLTLLLYGGALCVGITRIYVGMHYPRDVLAGIVLGMSWGLIGVSINSYLFARIF